MDIHRIVATVIVLVAAFGPAGLSLTHAADSPGAKQLAFAEHLQQQGDDAFALLEYKRFLFLYPDEVGVPGAQVAVARIQLGYVQDLPAGRETLLAVQKAYPKSAAAADAKALLEFIAANSDLDAKPLMRWFQAAHAESSRDWTAAADGYGMLATQYPRARLADDALYRRGVLQLEQLQNGAAARDTFATLLRQYPKSPFVLETRFRQAAALETAKGSKEAIAAYRQLAQENPKTDVAKRANARIEELEKQLYVIKRQFPKADVLRYTVAKEGAASGGYSMEVELPVGSSERQVRATLEDGLLKAAEKRRGVHDTVVVRAYFNYPLSRAGEATWQPGNAPTYAVEEQKTEDVIKDVFIDLLKRKR